MMPVSAQAGVEDHATAFFRLTEFPELDALVQRHAVVRDELRGNALWMKWPSDSYDASGKCLFLTGDWKVCPVYFGDQDPYSMVSATVDRSVVDRLLASLPVRFPNTVALLGQLPGVRYAAFSRLHPGGRLQPHRHKNPGSLIFHMGLIVPPGGTCGLQVGGQTHLWLDAGDAVIFDDNLEHSAWNDSDQERIILYVDFVRPRPASS
jgi:hypothetical protein